MSIQRMNRFLQLPELNLYTTTDDSDDAIKIVNGEFAWPAPREEQQPTTLKNINLAVRKGELLAVIGAVGSGTMLICSSFVDCAFFRQIIASVSNVE